MAAVRPDATEQASTAIVRAVRRIGIEDMSARGMARRVADAPKSRLLARISVKGGRARWRTADQARAPTAAEAMASGGARRTGREVGCRCR